MSEDPLIQIVANIQENTVKHTIDLCEKALWGLLHANPVKAEVESSYNHGYRIGWKECQKLGINLIERVIEELKMKDEKCERCMYEVYCELNGEARRYCFSHQRYNFKPKELKQ